MDNITCSVCGISKDLARFYFNSRYGTSLCNKHYLQIKNHGKILDASQPNLNDKRIYWTKNDEEKLIELINNITPFKEISKILKRSREAISHKIIDLGIDTSKLYKNNINFKAIYQDYDWCYDKYINEGLNHEEMALEANCTKRVIEKWCCEKHKLTQEYRQVNKKLNSLQKDLIIGSMLGDGHIDKRDTQPMFIVSHAENQKDYLYYKYNILKDLCNISPVKKEAQYKDFNGKLYLCQPSYRFCTRIYNCLLEYRNKSYTYLLNLMNTYSFSIWMLDDGFRDSSIWELCVAEYTKDDIDTAFEIFRNKYGLKVWSKKDTRYISFDAESSRKIDNIILNNIPSTLDIIKYKIIENKLSKPQKHLYIDKDNKITLATFCKDNNLDYKYVWRKLNRGSTIDEILLQKVVNV